MAKWCKKLLGLAAIGTAVAGLIYYFKKNDTCEDDEFSEDFEDEDFDLDSDLKPVSDREYVPLTPSAKPEDGSGMKIQRLQRGRCSRRSGCLPGSQRR